MITGKVNSALEAKFTLLLRDANEITQPIDVVIDTGFNGFLSLKPAQLALLGATWLYRGQGILADGSV
jgi:predicted aspartyl protease